MLSAHPSILSPYLIDAIQHKKLVHLSLLPVKQVNVLALKKKKFDYIKCKDIQWNLKFLA